MSTSSVSQELAVLLGDLVRIKSHSGEEGAVQAFIARWFEDNGIPARIEPAAGGLTNVVAEVSGGAPGPTLFIGGHCDTVTPPDDWSMDPYTPVIRDGRLYGVGAMDMKSGIATAMHSVRDLARRRGDWAGRVIFAALADEEAYSRGARGFLEQGHAIDAAIMCEPHFDIPSIASMGKINLKVVVTGRSAHGSHPADGINAVTEAARLIVAIDGLARPTHPEFGTSTHCVLNVSSGTGVYEIRVPDRCEFLINWHFLPTETAKEAVATIAALAHDLRSPARFDVTIAEPRYDSFVMDEVHPFVAAFAGSYRHVLGKAPPFTFCFGVSDANIFNGAGIPTLLFGPGGANMHAADEWADLSQMEKARAVYLDLAEHFLVAPTQRTAS
ncbi:MULTISPECIES: M20/M25/M40 family metallo-hydrolase [unclassified Chelatococcus]|uniref:M20 family metallopeptidase n=1 Tax=unclassified Chelatococcus TaxID=2638111 RepID=UPI001BD0E39E|nr:MULTISPECIES: M20/M25/M40 family metallo-hydrolase [unclassified Chelatococcus]MBS7701173.1 M20/M25/M40 family metallo-hydrolase [Chelatococcus sp. YT9]MBX3557304.1 M20/M25/M40 family metallo-hydrolase [Chelatococcus sp.]